MPGPAMYSRRAFLARAGILGAVVTAGGALATMPVWAKGPTASPLSGASVLEDLVGLLRPVLQGMAHDAMSGLAVFAFPGLDPYSKAQGTPGTHPGAIQARGEVFLTQALDQFVPFPDLLARPVAAAFSTALADINLALPNPTQVLPVDLVDNLDKALSFLLQNDQTIPLSTAVAVLLNLLATQVNPSTLTPGSALGPFSRLSFAEKARAFELLEDSQSDLVATLDMQLPEPLRDSASGLLKFLGGSLLEFAAFGSYNEFGSFDPATRQLTSRPVGWELSGYQPDGVVDGWDEFKGYYQGRQSVVDV